MLELTSLSALTLEMTLDLLSIVEVISVDTDVAIKGGEIYSRLAKNGEAIELNDCLIAATSLSVGIYEIVTEIVGKAYFSNISALLSKLDRAQHSDLVLTIFLEVSI